MNPRKTSTPRNICNQNGKSWENIKSIKGKAANNIQRNSYKAISLFFSRHCRPDGSGTTHLKDEGGKPSTKNTLPVRLSFKFEEVIKSFLDKQKLKEFITTKTVLQEILKTLLTRNILIHLLLPDHWLEVYQYVLKHETINITM